MNTLMNDGSREVIVFMFIRKTQMLAEVVSDAAGFKDSNNCWRLHQLVNIMQMYDPRGVCNLKEIGDTNLPIF